MKKFLMATVALSAVIAMPAMAAPGTTQTYNFDGTVAPVCVISGAASTVGFGALTDAAGAYTQGGTSKDAVDTNAYCNQALTSASISHTNLVNSNAASTGYTNVIPLSAALTTAQNVTVADTTTASGTGSSTGSTGVLGSFTGLKVTATLGTIGANKLVSGSYNGSITVTLTPAS